MIDLAVPGVAAGSLALVAAILYSAWHEYRLRNVRDAKLLAVIGAGGLAASAVSWFP